MYHLTEKDCYNSANFKCSLKHLIPTLSEKPQLPADKSSVCKMKHISSRSAEEIVREKLSRVISKVSKSLCPLTESV